MNFKTQAQIFQHLLNGGMVKHRASETPVKLIDGIVKHIDGYEAPFRFNIPADWTIYEEPKKYELDVLFKRSDDGTIYPIDIESNYGPFIFLQFVDKKFKMNLEEIKK